MFLQKEGPMVYIYVIINWGGFSPRSHDNISSLFDKPSFKDLSLTHDRPSNLSLLQLLTNFLNDSDEQGFLH